MHRSTKYDVAVLGGGPGGYTAAIRAAQRGLRTVCIENDDHLGGVGVNWGCIPSKAMLNYTQRYRDARKMLGAMGIETGDITFSFEKMQQAKLDSVRRCTDDIAKTFKKLRIDHCAGWGKFVNDREISVDLLRGGNQKIEAKNFIIATGSLPNELKNLPFDEQYICSSSGALEQEKVPETLFIYGGGIVGIEIACCYARLGSDVTVVQRGNKLCTFLDSEIAVHYVKAVEEDGVKFMVDTEINVAENFEEEGIYLNMTDISGGQKREFAEKTDVVLVSVGRTPNTKNIGLDKAGI
jgi:dihydrolipoamide dehydrogenase